MSFLFHTLQASEGGKHFVHYLSKEKSRRWDGTMAQRLNNLRIGMWIGCIRKSCRPRSRWGVAVAPSQSAVVSSRPECTRTSADYTHSDWVWSSMQSVALVYDMQYRSISRSTSSRTNVPAKQNIKSSPNRHTEFMSSTLRCAKSTCKDELIKQNWLLTLNRTLHRSP